MSVNKALVCWTAVLLTGLSSLHAQTSAAWARTYHNPLLPKQQMADPHVIKVGETYYLYSTTHTKGYDAYTSKDLVTWTNAGSVYRDPRGGCWAPDVFFNKRDGKYYLYYTVDSDPMKRGGKNKLIGVAQAQSPLGKFTDKGTLAEYAIDAHMFLDDDKKFYLYYVDLSEGFKIMVQPMDDPVTKAGVATMVINPTEPWETKSGAVTEGPFMLKRDDTYYLMYSGTGADSPDYGIGYATAKSPTGPFTKHPQNPIVSRTDKVFGPGHHSIIEGPDNKLWMIYHQKWDKDQSFNRFLAMDPIWFDDDGVIRATVSRDTPQPAPRPKASLRSPKLAPPK